MGYYKPSRVEYDEIVKKTG
ncbi:hypothetical protein [Clostridium estertheticum]|nr:hypothetical protein [Clostridium estertheticum]